MIDNRGRSRVAAPAARRGAERRRQWLLTILGIVLILAGAAVLIYRPDVSSPVSTSATAAPPARSPSPPIISSSPGVAATSAAPALALSGPVPAHGSGDFAYASTRGRVHGTKGTLRRFRVAVEKGSGEDVDEFAASVDATLGDERSWTGGGDLRLQMVAGRDEYDFTVYLATRDTAGDMCARGGTNITVGGRPYTSCRATGQAIINLDRWRLSSKTYRDAKVPLATYRQYVINHEVGHELGHHHEGCPKQGGPAPVMVQQTLTLRGCVPYAWPRRGGKELDGPGL